MFPEGEHESEQRVIKQLTGMKGGEGMNGTRKGHPDGRKTVEIRVQPAVGIEAAGPEQQQHANRGERGKKAEEWTDHRLMI